MSEPASITCPTCGMTSFNSNDVRERYCGNCHQYHDVLLMREDGRGVLAQLYFTWNELDTLASLVDDAIARPITRPFNWGKLNSLRTALREAQQTVRRSSDRHLSTETATVTGISSQLPAVARDE